MFVRNPHASPELSAGAECGKYELAFTVTADYVIEGKMRKKVLKKKVECSLIKSK